MAFTTTQSLSACSADSPAEPATEYIRQARRLRHRHRNNPARLHQSLCKLNAPATPAATASPARTSASAVLTCEVEEAMDGPILRYDERSRLLRRAEELGLGRFEANLLIAAIQHQRRGQANVVTYELPARRGWGVWNILALALALEAAALAAGWWAILGG